MTPSRRVQRFFEELSDRTLEDSAAELRAEEQAALRIQAVKRGNDVRKQTQPPHHLSTSPAPATHDARCAVPASLDPLYIVGFPP